MALDERLAQDLHECCREASSLPVYEFYSTIAFPRERGEGFLRNLEQARRVCQDREREERERKREIG